MADDYIQEIYKKKCVIKQNSLEIEISVIEFTELARSLIFLNISFLKFLIMESENGKNYDLSIYLLSEEFFRRIFRDRRQFCSICNKTFMLSQNNTRAVPLQVE